MAKSDKQTVLKRIQEIYQMICQGASSFDICQYASESWGISDRQVRRLIQFAYQQIDKKISKDMNVLRNEAIVRYDKLYTKLYKDGKYGEAGKIQAYKNKINGLESSNINVKNENTIEIKTEFKIDDERLKRIVNETLNNETITNADNIKKEKGNEKEDIDD